MESRLWLSSSKLIGILCQRSWLWGFFSSVGSSGFRVTSSGLKNIKFIFRNNFSWLTNLFGIHAAPGWPGRPRCSLCHRSSDRAASAKSSSKVGHVLRVPKGILFARQVSLVPMVKWSTVNYDGHRWWLNALGYMMVTWWWCLMMTHDSWWLMICWWLMIA